MWRVYDALMRDQLPQIRRQLTLIDVSARRVVWKYLIDLGADKTVGPDDRLWCVRWKAPSRAA